MKATKKEIDLIKEYISSYYYNTTGYRKINGGFANFDVVSIIKLNAGDEYWFKVSGELESGIEDMGSGHSKLYKDYIDNIYLRINKGCSEIKFMDKATIDEVEDQFDLEE